MENYEVDLKETIELRLMKRKMREDLKKRTIVNFLRFQITITHLL